MLGPIATNDWLLLSEQQLVDFQIFEDHVDAIHTINNRNTLTIEGMKVHWTNSDICVPVNWVHVQQCVARPEACLSRSSSSPTVKTEVSNEQRHNFGGEKYFSLVEYCWWTRLSWRCRVWDDQSDPPATDRLQRAAPQQCGQPSALLQCILVPVQLNFDVSGSQIQENLVESWWRSPGSLP